MKRLNLFLILCALAMPATASNWVTISKEKTSESEWIHEQIDAQSVTIKQGLVRAWIRSSFSPVERTDKGEAYSTTVNFEAFDCQGRESGFTNFTRYSAPYATGKLISSITGPLSMVAIIPDTAGEARMKAACAIASKNATKHRQPIARSKY